MPSSSVSTFWRNGDGHEDDVVAGLAEDLAEPGLEADHAERIAADGDRPADRVEGGEELVLDVGADDRDRRGVRVLGRVEEAPRLEVEVEHGVGRWPCSR